MPLIHRKSDKAFDKNVETEMKAHPGPEHRAQNLAIAYAIKRKAKKAHGGMVEEELEHERQETPQEEALEHSDGHQEEADELDMVGKIMHARKMSEGGMVANGGEDDLEKLADGRPNEFDDLALRDDLEFSETGANSGDELGDAREDEDRHDTVAQIMRSRAKKGRMPSPR